MRMYKRDSSRLRKTNKGKAKGKEIDPKMTSLPWTEDNGKAITSATTTISRRSWWLRCLAPCCCSSRVTCLFFFTSPSGKDARRARSLRNRGHRDPRFVTFDLLGVFLLVFFWPFPCVIWDEVLRNENLKKKITKSIWGSTKIRFDVRPKREKTPPSTNQVGPRESLPYIIYLPYTTHGRKTWLTFEIRNNNARTNWLYRLQNDNGVMTWGRRSASLLWTLELDKCFHVEEIRTSENENCLKDVY